MFIWFSSPSTVTRCFVQAYLARLEEIMRDACAGFGAELAEFHSDSGHVHLLVNFSTTVAISRLVNLLKSASPCRLRQEFPTWLRHCWQAKRLWSGPLHRTVGDPPDQRAAPAHRAAVQAVLTVSRPAELHVPRPVGRPGASRQLRPSSRPE